ncbi:MULTISPECIES: metal ABC transporter solute-binding protein, Zn/Mn family [Paenibacillus]|uniref:metal ABC transporter solute-binding protein, Zn/Mn family n=1 Tax=Paenibacillus TaxID=44249 RepID=UPI0022B8BB2E|nr:zinc ABC transporter substrate-binding protein [Paenibacillus caseinilyticus]MCZ8520676.1 zinc ABC transporter substrate-binding protein [Paenibacillus caseinilyticus]
MSRSYSFFRRQLISRFRRTFLPLFLMLALAVVSACGKPQAALVNDKINVVTSFYPLYDFSSKIGGEHVNAINVVPAGVEPHDWSPKSRDIQNIKNSQVFVYLGAGFEGWVNDTLESLKTESKSLVVEAGKGVERIEGTGETHQHEEETGHDEASHDEATHDEASHDDAAQDNHAVDPHIWLSPVNAKKIAGNIKNALVQADSAHAADYEANYKKLAADLDALHGEYKAQLAGVAKKEIVVTHQSFGYLAKEYGLTQKPIMGLAPDAEPTSKDLQSILRFIKENDVKYIFFEELVSDKLARTLAQDAGVETAVLNPLEGLTQKQMDAGDDYVKVMKNNLNSLLKALQ